MYELKVGKVNPEQQIAPLLEKIVQLTTLKKSEQVSEAFLDFILSEFDEMNAVALYKLDLLPEIPELSLELFRSSEPQCNYFDASDDEFLYNFIPVTIKEVNEFYNFSDKNLLIVRANRDKNFIFFLVYRFSNKKICHQDICYLPTEQLKEQVDAVKLLSLLYYSSIFRNQQVMISLKEKDSLTGLYNRKSFDHKMRDIREMNTISKHRRSKEGKGYTCLAILDIDHFKRINDTYGHLYGDEVLLHFSQQMQKIFRKDDLLFRYGGEEFIVLLKDVNDVVAEEVLHRFRKHIESYNFPRVPQVTVSIGMTYIWRHLMQSEIVDQADHALYYIKDHGRNNVGSYDSLVSQNLLKEIETKDDIELF